MVKDTKSAKIKSGNSVAKKPPKKKTASNAHVEKAKVGRPSLYRPEYCGAIIAHMADGASITSFAGSIGVARDTIVEWTHVHPEFSVAVSIGKAKCASWWEKVNRNLATGRIRGNPTSCIVGLKNMGREDWQDRSRHEVSGPDGAPIRSEVKVVIDDETISRIADRLLNT